MINKKLKHYSVKGKVLKNRTKINELIYLGLLSKRVYDTRMLKNQNSFGLL
jgi:hypothetical protein